MRRYLFASCTILLAIVFVSCKTVEPILPPPQDASSGGGEIITLEGEFRSTKGVMTSLSCYCYNSGVIKQADESMIDICFEENVDVSCTKIRVTGWYVNEHVQVDENNPCASGSMELFKVISYTCL